MNRWLTIDPGETTGWAIWQGEDLVEAGQTPLWEFIDLLWVECLMPSDFVVDHGSNPFTSPAGGRIELIVCEDWALYPWAAKALSWDKCRTARGIGAIELLCRHGNPELVLQPAKIKEAATAAGAEDLFLTPRHENRHANDAILHGVYYLVRGRAASQDG